MAGLPGSGSRTRPTPRDGLWGGAIIAADDEPDAGFNFARSLRRGDHAIAPVLLLVRGSQLSDLDGRHDIFDDFCVTPFHPVEFEARLRHLLAPSRESPRARRSSSTSRSS